MSHVMAWIRSMPLTIISVLAVIVSLSFLGWAWSQGGTLRDEMSARGPQISQIEGMMNQSIPIPGREPGDEEIVLRGITINEHTIETLSQLYHRMQNEHEEVLRIAVSRNRSTHEPMIDGIFPEPEDIEHPFRARDRYRVLLPRLLRTPDNAATIARQADADDDDAPYLIVGRPPNRDDLRRDIERFGNDLRETLLAERNGRDVELTRAQVEQINQEKTGRLRDALYRHAQRLHVYAEPDIERSNYPLHVHQLYTAGEQRPQGWELWEAQLELWIQHDLLRAIRLANEAHRSNASLLDGPFKRLVNVEVVPGYVGLHTRGGVVGGDGRMQLPYRQPEGYSKPGENEVPRNFALSPTGRVSNPSYDVRHVRVTAVVDYTRLPEVFDAIHAVNFMTVLHTDIRNVDEFSHYSDGYVYGEGVDAVEVTMVIETLWLREWTREFMPPRVRSYLGIDERWEDEDGRGPGHSPGGWGPPGMEGGW